MRNIVNLLKNPVILWCVRGFLMLFMIVNITTTQYFLAQHILDRTAFGLVLIAGNIALLIWAFRPASSARA
jgi:hypothetical protein